MKKVAFLFPGQGSQSIGMGEEIYREYDVVREIFDMASEVAQINLSALCFKGPIEELTLTVNLQPAITAVNLGILAVVQKESATPAVTAGHSLGEYSALCAAGVISREDAVALVTKRGELMHREATKHDGAMHAIVGLPIDAVQALVDEVKTNGIVSVANHNTELQIVITGSPEPVERVSSLAAEQGAKTIPLNVSGAWHSELIAGALQPFRECLDSVPFAAPESGIVLNVTGDFETDPGGIKSAMAGQLCSPVKWYDSMKKILDAGVEGFAEIGPGRVLAGLLKKTVQSARPSEHPSEYSGGIHSVNNLKTLERFLRAVT